MTPVDLLLAAFVFLLSLLGLRAGLLSAAFSLAGGIAGAYLGARAAPALASAWPATGAPEPLVFVGAALCGALLGRFLAGAAGRRFRSWMVRLPVLGRAFGALDGLGGAVLGAALGLGLVWVLGFVALQTPLPAVRQAAEGSGVIRALNDRVPPGTAGEVLSGAISPSGSTAYPLVPRNPPPPSAASRRGAGGAAAGVVRVSAAGGPVFDSSSSAGSGWTAAPGIVVTNAHVVEGARSVGVGSRSSRDWLPAEVLVSDERNDVAVLEVDGLRAPSLPTGRTSPGQPVTILGYPGAGAFDAAPGRVVGTGPLLTTDATDGLPVRRTITAVSGDARPGNSGGPVVNARGEVVATIFGTGIGPGRSAAYAVPSSVVEERVLLAQRRRGVTEGA